MPTPTYNPDSLFCKIANGEIPSHKIFEDDLVFAFLDIGPLSKGHCLVIPKGYYPTLDTMPDDVAAAIGRVLPRLSRAVMKATGATSFNVLQNNGELAHQAVGHVHFHIIPKFSPGDGLGIQWPAGELSPKDGKTLAEAIQSELA